MKPGPHRHIDGTLHAPIGTLGEMIQRAIHGEPPVEDTSKERFLHAVQNDERFAEALASILERAKRA